MASRTQREEEFKLASDTDTISEDEFLTLFGEAVISRRTKSNKGTVDVVDTSYIEVITGIAEFSSRHKDTTKLYDDPRFGNLKITVGRTILEEGSDDGLAQKMRGVLYIPTDEQIEVSVPLIDQGVDSLLLQFSKMLLIDIPILKVISGASITELAEEAARRLPRATIPLIELEDGVVVVSESGNQDSSDSTLVSSKPLQQLTHDRSIFYNSIGVFMKECLDLVRLQNAFATCLQRHEIFRTSFHSDRIQSILDAPKQDIKCIRVDDRAAAEEAYRELETKDYDLAAGKTLKLVNLYRDQDEHLFVKGYHRLVGDGSTTQNFLNEVGQIYDGAQLSVPPQYSNFALRQRSDVETGNMDSDIAYWTSMYTRALPVLPVLLLPQAKSSRTATTFVAWKQHVGMLCPSSVLFANLLPVRMEGYSPEQNFADELLAVKERMCQAMQHPFVPYGVTLARLGLDKPATELQHAPLFQAIFDYRQGAAETGRLGKASFTEIWASRERMPHDVVLEMCDDPAKGPLVTVKFQSYLFTL
ncbi:beta-ketoacyl synthase domain-containing [Pyrenophora seminiperda CCB06]|uniref:Beta-ketoacyl synthase domain-containing n=1 Tax=Pyrenophora seminiperda CCB06 TaxID=1302712 RepID=A0A3M7M2L1_9PLEO|nr:beta-ketoacyl synthase domain-containing [Pyrenophora seminiperda CCB06]